jgi:hypothetical protein
VNTDEQVEAAGTSEDICDLEPEQDVKRGWPYRYQAQ